MINIKVLKFGGSSVETIEKMKLVANRIIEEKKKDDKLVVVVSAMGKTTNNLYNLAKQASHNPNKREVDLLLSTGEMISISLLSIILNDLKCPSISLTGPQAGIKTKGLYTKSSIVDIDTERIEQELSENKVVIIAGFQGVNYFGDITTIGREGSDTTAVAIANSLKCSCEIYTDVDGIYSVDPNIYPKAKKLSSITYDELEEMAKMGSKVVAYSAIQMGKKNDVPIYVASTFKDTVGTYIIKGKKENGVRGIAVNEKVIVIDAICSDYTYLTSKLESFGYRIELIESSEIDKKDNKYVFVVTGDDLDIIDEIIKDLDLNDYKINIHNNLAVLSVIGCCIQMDYITYLLKNNSIDTLYTKVFDSKVSVVLSKDMIKDGVTAIACYFNL